MCVFGPGKVRPTLLLRRARRGHCTRIYCDPLSACVDSVKPHDFPSTYRPLRDWRKSLACLATQALRRAADGEIPVAWPPRPCCLVLGRTAEAALLLCRVCTYLPLALGTLVTNRARYPRLVCLFCLFCLLSVFPHPHKLPPGSCHSRIDCSVRPRSVAESGTAMCEGVRFSPRTFVVPGLRFS